jgi:PilZ domain-containing protein
VEAVIRIQVLDLHSGPVTPSARAVTSPQLHKINLSPQAPSLLLSQDSAAATSVAAAARREQIPLDTCADVPSAIEMVSRKRYRAVLVDFDLLGSCDLFSSFSGHEQKPIGLAMLPAAASLSDAFAAGFRLAIHKPLSMQPVRLGLKAAYEFGHWARRSSPRAGIGIPTLVGSAKDGVLRGSILNLSEKGACLALEQEVISGTFMTVRFALPGAPLIDLGAMVVWDGAGRSGVQFHRMHCRHRAGIGAWVRGGHRLGRAEA